MSTLGIYLVKAGMNRKPPTTFRPEVVHGPCWLQPFQYCADKLAFRILILWVCYKHGGFCYIVPYTSSFLSWTLSLLWKIQGMLNFVFVSVCLNVSEGIKPCILVVWLQQQSVVYVNSLQNQLLCPLMFIFFCLGYFCLFFFLQSVLEKNKCMPGH